MSIAIYLKIALKKIPDKKFLSLVIGKNKKPVVVFGQKILDFGQKISGWKC